MLSQILKLRNLLNIVIFVRFMSIPQELYDSFINLGLQQSHTEIRFPLLEESNLLTN